MFFSVNLKQMYPKCKKRHHLHGKKTAGGFLLPSLVLDVIQTTCIGLDLTGSGVCFQRSVHERAGLPLSS